MMNVFEKNMFAGNATDSNLGLKVDIDSSIRVLIISSSKLRRKNSPLYSFRYMAAIAQVRIEIFTCVLLAWMSRLYSNIGSLASDELARPNHIADLAKRIIIGCVRSCMIPKTLTRGVANEQAATPCQPYMRKPPYHTQGREFTWLSKISVMSGM
jgi:hypothetical protein